MVYRALGIMSGSSLDGLDMALVEFQEVAGKWVYSVKAADCYPYNLEWKTKLGSAINLSAFNYQLLHCEYGHYIGNEVNRFVEANQLPYQIQLIASHGHTTFHAPAKKMTAQLGDGAAIAAVTGVNVVSDLRVMDIALGGQGAPIVPIGEKLLWPGNKLLLNIGGIANISLNDASTTIAFDICAANRVLNLLANEAGKEFDENGAIAATGKMQEELLVKLNSLEYYSQPYPKSLANDFGTDLVYKLIKNAAYSIPDSLCTYVQHISIQVRNAIERIKVGSSFETSGSRLLVTGGGAHNLFLIERLRTLLSQEHIELIVPEKELIDYKEAIVMALIGVLRWREENNILSSVTGAKRNSIGGAVWIGQEA